jgi:hypothetical protein
MKEIESKNLKLQSLSKKELKEYTLDHEIPVVLGPSKEMYMIDHHHFARSCWEQNISEFSVTVIKDLSHKKEKDFWNFMIDKDWVYLHDQFGMGPHSPSALPVDIRCLADDPFRSLAWAVINEGYIKKQKVPFFEFKWAAFFRRNLDISLHSKSNFKTAINLANRLARSKAAKNIPGFIE